MILGPKILLQLVKKVKLVEGLSKRELTDPEGAGFDLRLGEVYKISGKSYLGITERHTPEVKLVAKYEEPRHPGVATTTIGSSKKDSIASLQNDKKIRTKSITFKPGDFFLVKTIETINLPVDMSATILPRSTTYRSGLFLRTGNVQPGYSGGLIFGLKNEGPVPVTIELGARFVHIQFHEVKGGGSTYRGQWQGGRVTTKKKEKQV